METEEKYKERKEAYFLNLPHWPEFDIFDKNIDGLIPSARLESWEQFHEVVKTYSAHDGGGEYIFRGQHHYEWALDPSLDRLCKKATQEDIARRQLRNFRLSIRGRVPDNAIFKEDNEELWAIGQHHGLATPLLDWTLAPYVGLFFAFMTYDSVLWVDDKRNFSRAIYVLNKSFLEDLINEGDPIDLGYPKILEPSKDDHGRLVNQAGLFTIAPYGETLESALFNALTESEIDVDDPKEVSQYICKLHIPNDDEARQACLRHLRKMNIHHASLFPDVIGASDYCNELISEAINNNKKPVEKNILSIQETAIKKEFFIPETDGIMRELIKALIVDDSVKKISIDNLKGVVKAAIEFIDEKAGVDWYVRDSQLARLKNILRRHLKKIQFPDDHISTAAESLSEKIAEIGKNLDSR